MSIWSGQAARLDRACQRVFGDPVLYRTGAADPGRTLTAVLDRDYQLVKPHDDGSTITTTATVLSVVLADLPAPPKQGHLVTAADGTVYRVTDIHDDGPGAARLVLQRVQR